MSDVVSERVDRVADDALVALEGLYGQRAEETWRRLVDLAGEFHDQRAAELRERDRRREADRGWFLDPKHVGYKAYAERLGGTLRGVADRVGHLNDLGVTFLHLMSVLKPREGESDGGYAVDDYMIPDPSLGSVEDLRWLAETLADSGINLVIDLVLNHTSDQHEWARRAREGSQYHEDLYLTFPDRVLPDRFEASLPEVFPTMAPGNFTWVPGWKAAHDMRRSTAAGDADTTVPSTPAGGPLGRTAAVTGRKGLSPAVITTGSTQSSKSAVIGTPPHGVSRALEAPATPPARASAGIGAADGPDATDAGIGIGRTSRPWSPPQPDDQPGDEPVDAPRGEPVDGPRDGTEIDTPDDREGGGRWVWTTFREFQWDLNWANPDVMIEMVRVALHLSNLGISVLRLDAIAFTWKRLGTDCQNQPEAHLVGQVLRAILEVAAPSTLLLAEAIVGPSDLVGYLGGHEFERSECHLAYHNQLMVQGWSLLASQESGLAEIALNDLPTPPASTTWFTYVRNHDDIGWAIDDAHAAAAGLDGAAHRRFLAEFYRGDFAGTFARGTPFSTNEAAADERTSGMAATLAGLTAAEESGFTQAITDALARHRFVHAIAYGWGGIPLLYMGDEFAQQDAPPDPASAIDSRWLHRPYWDPLLAAEAERDPSSIPGRALANIAALGRARRRCRPLHGGARSDVVWAPRGVFAWRRRHPRYGEMLGLANPSRAQIDVSALADMVPPTAVDALGAPNDQRWMLGPYEIRWITDALRPG